MPLYTNNENLKVVDMCKVFDEEFPREDRNDDKLFRYLYLIVYAVTLKEKPNWFKDYDEYDAYAIYSTKVLYTRFIKQQREGKTLKSILNYFHGAMNGLRINFQKEEFAEIIDSEHNGFSSEKYLSDMQTSLSNEYYGEEKEFEITKLLKDIHKVARKVINESPYSRDKVMSHRLYISMLLTFLSNLTINNKAKSRFNKKVEKNPKDIDDTFTNLLEKEKQEKPILWKLDESMSDYVRLLVNKMKFKLAKDLRDIQNYYIIPEDVVTGIMASAYSDGYKNAMEEE